MEKPTALHLNTKTNEADHYEVEQSTLHNKRSLHYKPPNHGKLKLYCPHSGTLS